MTNLENTQNQPYLQLNDGTEIPQLGIGVYQIPEGTETENAVLTALEIGYRHIDTAHAYQNERSVGRAVKKSGISRQDIWITTKLWPNEYGEGKTLIAINKMLERLDTDYIDLLLLHQRFGDYLGAWKDMERAVREGKVKSIGLSNFESERLEEVLKMATIKPSVLQVELHPYYQQTELKKRVAPYDTVLEAWYPLGHGDSMLLEEPVLVEIGKKYSKSSAQIILRWHIQEGIIVFPRSTKKEHLQDNFDIFDFELTDKEMNAIRGLDKGERYYNFTLEQQDEQLSGFAPDD